MNHQELIERLRSFEIDHEPDGWPGVRMRQISAMCDAIESLLAENERLKHNLTSTEQTMREYQELAAKRLEEIAKYRDAPVACAQYQDREGNWKPFINANHEHNTRASMDWPVRDLIVKPEEEK